MYSGLMMVASRHDRISRHLQAEAHQVGHGVAGADHPVVDHREAERRAEGDQDAQAHPALRRLAGDGGGIPLPAPDGKRSRAKPPSSTRAASGSSLPERAVERIAELAGNDRRML